jgi:2,3-bisphosphoglycerate-independent phosphoglycerate mutase
VNGRLLVLFLPINLADISKMNLLFFFIDGLGLGSNDKETNPLVSANMPVLDSLLNGKRLISGTVPFESDRATLFALDACLNIEGMPQSATGQAALLTGQNIPALVGRHYGPKPNREITDIVKNKNLFKYLLNDGQSAVFLNAYPPSYFKAIYSGRRIYAVIPLAATSAGISLRTAADLGRGEAISADFTAQGWRDHLGHTDTPVLSLPAAGQRLTNLAQKFDFSLFEYWLSDYAGHRQNMLEACRLLESFDQVLGGLLESWEDNKGIIIITSDHGNLEDLSSRRHTKNPVPALVIGATHLREQFTRSLHDLTDITPAILKFLKV